MLTMAFNQRLAGLLRILWEPRLAVPLLAGVTIRLVLLPWFSDPFNFWGTYLSTSLLLDGVNPFALVMQDPGFNRANPWGYPGLYFAFTSVPYIAAGGDSFLYGIFLRVPSVLLDAATSILLFRLATRLGATEPRARLVALAFLFNPFSILVTSIWGTNDPIPIFFTVLAVFLLLRGRERDRDWAALALGAGVAVKVYPVLLLPVLLARLPGLRSKLRALGATALLPLASSAPFLVADPTAYLRVLFSLTTGQAGASLFPHFTIFHGIAFLTGAAGPWMVYVSGGGLVAALSGVYWGARSGRMSVTTGTAVALLVAYLLAVRWAQNYVLWVVPFTTLGALLDHRGWRRWWLGLFWLPAMAHALLYNGWYRVEFAGASGLPYWGLVAGAPQVRSFAPVPEATVGVLVGLFVAAAVGCVVLLAWPRGTATPKGSRRPQANAQRVVAGRSLRQTALVALLLVALVGGPLASLSLQLPPRGHVSPSDFASYVADGNGSTSLVETFRSDVLSFRWTYGGTGTYALRPGGVPGIRLDTGGPSGTSYLMETVSASSLTGRVTFRVLEAHGPGPLILLAEAKGWLGAVPASPSGVYDLVFFDALRNETHSLGSAGSGWHEATFTLSPEGRSVGVDGASTSLEGHGPVSEVVFGHGPESVEGGGVLELSRVELHWQAVAASPGPPPIATLASALGGAAALVAPALPRTRRHRPG